MIDKKEFIKNIRKDLNIPERTNYYTINNTTAYKEFDDDFSNLEKIFEQFFSKPNLTEQQDNDCRNNQENIRCRRKKKSNKTKIKK